MTLDLEIHQHLGSLKHVINIIIWIRYMGCYSLGPQSPSPTSSRGVGRRPTAHHSTALSLDLLNFDTPKVTVAATVVEQ
jgi:hypothetical protein